ncbi:MAG: hypothetical protein KJO41_06255 [Bacteroidia bacterium]|nr:hypothetical protein [Bacteroidia bacterium]NND24994.1 hypothetical protein [Flavobacteriaceae bacterium]
MKLLLKFLAMAILVLIVACSTEPISNDLAPDEIRASEKSSVDIINPILGEVTGTSTLHRSKSGLTVNYKTTGLAPGYAYTIWWVIWNNPEKCEVPGECTDSDFANAEAVGVEVLYAAGHVVGNSGKGNFSGHLNTDDDSASINTLFGLPPAGGLHSGKTFSAEVHLVLRSHGPKIPGMVSEQINSYEGGCLDPFAIAPFTEIPDEVGECGDIEFAIHPPSN